MDYQSPTKLGHLPENTRRLLAQAFERSLLIPHPTASRLLGCSEDTLREMGNRGDVEYHIKGRRTRVYSEASIINALLSGRTSNREETARSASASSHRRKSKVKGFVAKRAGGGL